MASCAFCSIAAGETEAALVLNGSEVVAFLDHRPVFPGHTLVIPRAHHETLDDLPVELLSPFFSEVRRVNRAVRAATGSQGTFVAMNNVVSQSVPHLHAHVVPRTKGDGLRGFFWPRLSYPDAAAAEAMRAAIARELTADGS